MDQEQQKFLIQDYLEAVLDHFHDGIYITDGEANTVYLNHSYELISGLQKSEMMGKNMKELVSLGVISRSGTLSVLKTGEEVTVEQSFRTGKRAIITSSPVYTGDDKSHLIMVVTIVREITEIYAIRKELKRKEQQNQNYLNELERIRRELDGDVEIVAVDPLSVNLIRLAERVAILDAPVFISGESGTGKNKIASFIHAHSSRSSQPFVTIDFASFPEDDVMGHLFGYTDKINGTMHIGVLESAQGGTLYLENFSEMPSSLQSVFVVLLTGKGSLTKTGISRKWNIRYIASGYKTLDELKNSRKWNQALLDAFSLFPLSIVPLRARKEDIVPLLHYFINQYNKKTGENKRFDRESYLELMEYHWPGNVRELGNLVQRAAIISETDTIQREDLFVEGNLEYDKRRVGVVGKRVNLKKEVAKLEAEYMEKAFQHFRNTRDAAAWLGMDSSTFVRKRQKYKDMQIMKDEEK